MNNILKWCFFKKVAHYYCTDVPRHMGWKMAYWYAVLLAQGATKERAEALWEVFYLLDVEHFSFWLQLFQQIVNASDRTLEKLDLVGTVETVALIKFGKLPNGQDSAEACFQNKEPHFQWKTRKLEYSVAYLQRCYTIQYLIPQDFEDSYTIVDKEEDCWHFTLLRNRHELFTEGKAMSHCVGDGDYHQCGLSGDNSFWSLQKRTAEGDLQRCLTVEVCHKEHLIETALGYENRDAEAAEIPILAEWCQLVTLKILDLSLAD